MVSVVVPLALPTYVLPLRLSLKPVWDTALLDEPVDRIGIFYAVDILDHLFHQWAHYPIMLSHDLPPPMPFL